MKHNATNYWAMTLGSLLFVVALSAFFACGCHAHPPLVEASAPCVAPPIDAGSDGGSSAADRSTAYQDASVKPANKPAELSAEEYVGILDACTDSCFQQTKQAGFCACVCNTVLIKIKSHHPKTLDDVVDLLPSVHPSQEEKMECQKASVGKSI